MSLKVVAIIPSRLESTRLPNKALADIHGMPMILHVYYRALLAKLVDEVYVATDSTQISDTITNIGGKVILTSSEHLCGSDRVAEAAKQTDADIIINVQGDEALLNPSHVSAAAGILIDDPSVDIGILVNDFSKSHSTSDIKVVLDLMGNVMYFSRSDIPYSENNFLKAYHIVPFRSAFLQKYTSLPRSPLEIIESNEYLRVLQHGIKMRALKVESSAISVDTFTDLELVRKKMKNDPFFCSYNK